MNIQELKVLYGKATKGEWESCLMHKPVSERHLPDRARVCAPHGNEIGGWDALIEGTYGTATMRPEDASVIVALHNAFPAIIARLEALERVAEAARMCPPSNYGGREIHAALSTLDALEGKA